MGKSKRGKGGGKAQNKKRLAYVCFPFTHPNYEKSYDKIQKALSVVHNMGYTPLLCSVYLMDEKPSNIDRLAMIKKSIEACHTLIFFNEKDITVDMLQEILYAREMDVEVFRYPKERR